MSLLDTASLIVTPNGYKEGTLYSVIPSDGSGDMSVVRATTATRVNSAGLVELVPYNLVQYSQEFNNWGLALATISPNATIAPNGTTTADKLIATTATGFHGAYQDNVISSNQGFHTVSCYAKKADYNFLIIDIFSGLGDSLVWFNINTGTIGTIINGGGSSSTTATIESVGNGWYRCSATTNKTSTTSGIFAVSLSNTDNVFSFAGDGTSGIYVWGAQSVQGSVQLDYQKTVTRLNIPRLDYSNGTCPSLLVEPQRTNVLQRSEEFNNGYWLDYRCDIGINTEISPSGIQNAETITSSVGETILPAIATVSFAFSGNTRYSTSLFVKKIGTVNTFSLSYVDDVVGFQGGRTTYNLVTQAITISQAPNNLVTASMEDYGNGWYRLIMNFTTIATPSYNYIEYSIPTVSTTNTFAIWGAQLEAGSYPTSYIPTTSASVTRNADYLTRSGFGNTSTSGTLFFDFYAEKIESSNGQYILNLFEGSVVNVSYPVYSSPNSLSIIANGDTIDIRNNAYSQQVQTFTPTAGQRVKIAIRYNGTNVSSAINGTLSSVFADTAVGVKNALRINNGESGTQAFNAVAFFPSYLTDTQLAQLTTI